MACRAGTGVRATSTLPPIEGQVPPFLFSVTETCPPHRVTASKDAKLLSRDKQVSLYQGPQDHLLFLCVLWDVS